MLTKQIEASLLVPFTENICLVKRCQRWQIILSHHSSPLGGKPLTLCVKKGTIPHCCWVQWHNGHTFSTSDLTHLLDYRH